MLKFIKSRVTSKIKRNTDKKLKKVLDKNESFW